LSGGELAVLIISGALLLLVLLLGLPLLKLGRLIDETTRSVQIFNNELEPMLAEAKVTLTETNKQLKRIDNITSLGLVWELLPRFRRRRIRRLNRPPTS